MRNLRLVAVSFLVVVLGACTGATGTGADSASLGQRTYDNTCAGCHDAPEISRAPSRTALESLPADAILGSLETGTMAAQGFHLSREEREAVAEYLGTGKVTEVDASVYVPAAGYCTDPGSAAPATGNAADWSRWGADLANTRFRSTQASGLAPDTVPRLTLKWAFAFPRSFATVSHPAYRNGHVFVGSTAGVAYALDAVNGCIRWTHRAPATMRGGIVLGEIGRGSNAGLAVFFGDTRARVSAVDAGTGELIWRSEVDSHPKARVTGAPQYYRGRLYVPVSSL